MGITLAIVTYLVLLSTSHSTQSNMTINQTVSFSKCNQLKLSVCWLNSPPYLVEDHGNGTISGAFDDAIEVVLKEELKQESHSRRLNYTKQVRNASELTECMNMNSGFDLVFPVLRSHVPNGKFHEARFQELISSPGIAVVKNREVLAEKAKWNVLNEFSQIWTVLVLALLLNAIFGIIIWALESRSNAEEFPPSFLRGSLEGIWWAFVTMTTVGYGDKAPKFFPSRLLSILWMFTGVTVMAYLTAMMTTALTSGIVTDHRTTVNVELGVLNNSRGYIEGMKQGVLVKEYCDLEALLRGLRGKEVEGALLDVFTTSYIFNNDDIETDMFEKVKTLEFPFHIGLYFMDNDHCLKESLKKRSQDQTWIYPYLLKHVKGPTVKDKGEKRPWKTKLNLFGSKEVAFRLALYTLSGVLAALIVLGLVWELFKKHKRRTFVFNKKGNKRVSGKGFPLGKTDFQQMVEAIADVEKSLAKISQLKEAYHKMEDYGIDWNSKQETKETNKV